VLLSLGSLQWCLLTAPIRRRALLWNGTHYVDKKLFLGFNATEQYNAHYVNTLIQNTTYALQQQVSIDEKIEVCLNTLEVALLAMGDEIQTIKLRQDLLSCRLPAYLYHCCSLQ
jgi:hypothetical protein